MMRSVERVAELREAMRPWRLAGERIAFVPTMGNLHDGHFSLVEIARRHASRVVVSSFVNPTQFGPSEDFSRYPRTPERDREGLAKAGCDLLFFPQVDEMYPFGIEHCVQIHVPDVTDELEGTARPGHFDGVATVVTRLFNAVQPDVVVLGSKDYQQLQTIRHLVRDLAMPIEIVAAPTRREADGLAMSSRNQYLDPAERERAALIHRTLRAMQQGVRAGRAIADVEHEAGQALRAGGFDPDYAQVRRGDDLKPPQPGERTGLVALIAARLGRTRLIDNLELDDPAPPAGG
jgi:pantoate--beta-alanine ligase